MSRNSGLFPQVNFIEFGINLISPYQQPYTAYVAVNDFKNLVDGESADDLPLKTETGFLAGDIPRVGAAKREFAGTAVFAGDKMVGTLSINL